MDRTERTVIELLPNIQALAVEAIPKATLAHADFRKAARRAGLERRHVGPTRAAELTAYLGQFASTPAQLRLDLGLEILNAAYDRLLDAFFFGDSRNMRIPICQDGPGQCGCGKPLLDEFTVWLALIQGWSKRMPLPVDYPHFFWQPGYSFGV